jgi:hypothetical protein
VIFWGVNLCHVRLPPCCASARVNILLRQLSQFLVSA